ncbi:MAG: L-threonylcarbamoyladenylate synthase [Halocynthiibacter sp.]
MAKTVHLSATPDGIRRAAGILRDGGLVAFPTETVYGLGGDACSGAAVARIFAAKDRPAFNPLIAHVADLDMALSIAQFDGDALRLAGAFWPGPLTLVLPLRAEAGLSPLTTAGLCTVGLRVPDHANAQALLAAFGGPVAAPSANPSGRISPTEARHVVAGLSGRIEAILDDGPCVVGLESTIIGFDQAGRAQMLRPGGLPAEAIEACLGTPLSAPPTPSQKPNAPGQLASHYAPGARLRLEALDSREGEVLLGFGPHSGGTLNLSPAGDLIEAAANLFSCLHRLDAGDAKIIAVSPIPDHGLGRAINDRLRRAAAPRQAGQSANHKV